MTDSEAIHRRELQFFPVSRRTLLAGGAAFAAAVASSCQSNPIPDGASTAAPTATQVPLATPRQARPVLAALHVHASFSEGPGSMEAQLAQADDLGYHTLWWTEHDWRMASHGYLTDLAVDQAATGPLAWRQGEGSNGEHRFEHEGGSSAGTESVASVWLRAAGSPGRGEHRLLADSAGHLYRTSLHGQTWTVMVQPELVESGLLGLDLRTSWRPATGDREEGFYWLSYRFGASAAGTTIRERRVEISFQLEPGEWTEFTLRPADDFTSAWPELDGRDASCVEVSLLAEAEPGGSAAGSFAGLTITRSGREGDAPLVVQRDLMNRYAAGYPSVQQLQGLEVSQGDPHVCWYGGTPRIAPMTQASPPSMTDEIRGGGGVASYAHPFGVGSQPSEASATVGLAAPVLERLLATGVTECDALEVGYRQRGGATLAAHESLWDALSRRGVFLTGLGVNDDHVGRDWREPPNNFGSWLWATSAGEDELVVALRSGHVYFGDPTLFTGQLDISPGAGGHMGSVVLGSGSRSDLRLLARDLPDDSVLELLVLEMLPDATPIDPASTVMQSIPASEIAEGIVLTSVSTAADCLVRTRVCDTSGQVIALSNPVWLLRDEATYRVPNHRRGRPQH